jgi:ATP-dependent RNA helicase SUPV3L1/SUV3
VAEAPVEEEALTAVDVPVTQTLEPAADAEAAPAQTEAAQADASEAEAVAPVEVELIEVWRPHRQHQGRRPERGAQQRRPQRGAPAPAQAGQAEPVAPVEGGPAPRRDDHRKGGGGNVRREGGSEGKPAGRPDRGPRPPGGGDRAKGGERDKGGERRPDRDRDQRRSGGGDRTFATTERPAPRERQPDPNSPFAKLLALKAELEGKGKKD